MIMITKIVEVLMVGKENSWTAPRQGGDAIPTNRVIKEKKEWIKAEL